jgi:hypothetical protein
MNKNVIIIVIIAVVIGAAGFFGGLQYEKSQRTQTGQFFAAGGQGAGRRAGQNGGPNANFRPVRGDILSSDDKSITVKMTDGSTRIVLLSGTTTIMQATSAAKTDLTPGKTVMVIGTQNTDGSVTAQSIQLNPQDQGFGGRGGGTPAPGQ